YLARAVKAGRLLGFRTVEITEIGESRAARATDRITEEGTALARAIDPGAVRVVLDPTGLGLTSEELAARIGQWRDSGRSAAFFSVGGADGLGPALRTGADLALSFGATTWPHQLVRIMLLEQLYRTMTILAGHPYHRV